MVEIRPIPTKYNGRWFRSRLEARAAELLDRAGVVWTYESEGLDCYGVWYLPDFHLPLCRTFVEVKGTVDDGALRKVDALARAANRMPRSGRFSLDTMDIESGRAGATLPVHVVMLDPLSIDDAERGEELRGFYAPAAHSGLHGKWIGGFCVSADREAVINECPHCRAVGFLWESGLPFCYGCGAMLGPAPDGPGAGAEDICNCGGTLGYRKLDRVPGAGVLRQIECDRCGLVLGERLFPYPGRTPGTVVP